MSHLPSRLDVRAPDVSLRTFRSTALCVLVLLACLVAAHPVAEAGVIDDWAYIWSAKILSQTGHVVYQGWATAMLTWQLYLGALFIKLFGFSFTNVRLSVVLLSCLSAGLMHRIFLRLGLNEWNAAISTLCVVLCPLFLPVEASFMSDIPGLFAVLVCWYCCLRTIDAKSDRSVLMWLIAAAVLNDVLGTARQISWLGALVMVPSAAWYVRRRRGVPVTAAILWVLSLAFVVGCIYWFRHQPYSIYEKLFFRYRRNHLWQLRNTLFATELLVFPVLIAFCLPTRTAQRPFRLFPFLFGFAAGCGFYFFDNGSVYSSDALWISSVLDSIPLVFKLMIMGISFAGLFCFLAELRDTVKGREWLGRGFLASAQKLPWLVVLGPFTCAYLFMVVTRAVIWQRYLLPIVPVLLALLVWVYTSSRMQRRLPVVSVAFVVVFGILAATQTHDQFAMQAARAAAVKEVEAAGIPRWQIEGQDELDGWAQVEMTGYVNDPRLLLPVGAYKPRVRTGKFANCHGVFFDWTPSIQPRFFVTYSTSPCFPLSQFPAVRYYTWAAPHERWIQVFDIPDDQGSSH